MSGLRAAAFPVLFLAFMLPLPNRVETPVQHFLQDATTSLSARMLAFSGLEVVREGFVLRLPSGELGVVEACSGVKSAAALAALAALLAYRGGFGPLRGVFFLLAVAPAVIAANVYRVTVSGWLQERFGTAAIQGTPHDLLGFFAFLIGLGLLALVAMVLRLPRDTAAFGAVRGGRGDGARDRPALAVSVMMLVACLAAAALGGKATRSVVRTAPFEQIPLKLDDWSGEEIPIPESVREILTFDRASHRVYRNPLGQEVHVWVIFWSGSGSVRGYHHPDVCWPNRGWEPVRQWREPIEIAGTGRLPVTAREFRNGMRRQVIAYWTQEGRRIWGDDEEEKAHAEGTPRHRWIRQRLGLQPAGERARLSVLVGADVWSEGDYAERAVLKMCQRFATELYEVVPWARLSAEPE